MIAMETTINKRINEHTTLRPSIYSIIKKTQKEIRKAQCVPSPLCNDHKRGGKWFAIIENQNKLRS